MNKLISIIFAMTATVAVAGEPEIRNCGDGYLGTQSYYSDCRELIYNEFLEGVDYSDKTSQKISDMKEQYWFSYPRKHLYCAVILELSAGDFLKIQECYND